MGCSHEFRDNLLYVIVEGNFEVTDCMRELDEATKAPGYRRGMGIVVDCRESTTSPPADEIRMASDFLETIWSRISGKFAIVVGSTLHYALGRMFAMYTNRGEDSVQVFRDMDQALDWVRTPPE